MSHDASVPTHGALEMRVTRNLHDLRAIKSPGLAWKVKNFFGGHYRGVVQAYASDLSGQLFGVVSMQSRLAGQKFTPDYSRLDSVQRARLKELLALNIPVAELASPYHGEVIDYGNMSNRVVTTAGVVALANNFYAGGFAISNFKYGGFGTGTGNEVVGDTTLGTEVPDADYAVNATRPTGTQSVGSSTNIYKLITTFAPAAGGTLAITEFGVLSQAATGGGTLWDRFKFSAINLVAGSDSLQVTMNLTCTAGG